MTELSPTSWWYVSLAGQVSGPFPEDQMRAWARQAPTHAYLRNAAGGEWVHLQQSPFASPHSISTSFVPRQAETARESARGVTQVLVECLHALRWCIAAALAIALSFALIAVQCVRAPLNVLDSREFWTTWVGGSQTVRVAHTKIDEWFESSGAQLAVALGGPGLNQTMVSVRARTHDALSGEVIDSIVGVVTGRDGLWQLQAAPFKERITQRFTHELETDLCADGRNSMCNRGQFNPAGRALAMGALGGTLDTLQPYLVDGLLASLPIVGPSRAAFFALRESLVIAPAILSVLGCLVLLFSWRLRTATFMFGCCCLFAGLALFGLSWTTHWVATLAGISEEVWQLAAAQTGSSSGLGSDDYGLMASGAALLLGRIFGPGWRRKFWERRLTSSDPGLAALASKRLSKPAGLREPAHVLGALVSRN